MAFRLTARARRDLSRILRYSFKQYGRDAADRYELLLTTALELVAWNADLAGSHPVDRRPGLRAYSISHARSRLPKGVRVEHPAHQLVYRLAADGVVEICAIVGDSYPATRLRPRYR